MEIRNPEAVDADVDTMQVSKADVVAPTKVGFQCCVTKQHEGYGLECSYSRVMKGILFGQNMLHGKFSLGLASNALYMMRHTGLHQY